MRTTEGQARPHDLGCTGSREWGGGHTYQHWNKTHAVSQRAQHICLHTVCQL